MQDLDLLSAADADEDGTVSEEEVKDMLSLAPTLHGTDG